VTCTDIPSPAVCAATPCSVDGAIAWLNPAFGHDAQDEAMIEFLVMDSAGRSPAGFLLAQIAEPTDGIKG